MEFAKHLSFMRNRIPNRCLQDLQVNILERLEFDAISGRARLADAFERDADPHDFSLEAILAHERGHQLIVWHSQLSRILAKGIELVSEEILASLIGSLIVESEQDRRDLYYKALYEAVAHGIDSTHAIRLLHELRLLLEKAL